MGIIIVKTSFESPKDAKSMAKKIIKNNLAVSTQVIPRITSYIKREGRIQSLREFVVLIHTTKDNLIGVENLLTKSNASHVPKIVWWEAKSNDPTTSS